MVRTFCFSQSPMLLSQPCKGDGGRGRQEAARKENTCELRSRHLLVQAVPSSNQGLRAAGVGAPRRDALGDIKTGAGEDVGPGQVLDESVGQPIGGARSAAALPLSTANQRARPSVIKTSEVWVVLSWDTSSLNREPVAGTQRNHQLTRHGWDQRAHVFLHAVQQVEHTGPVWAVPVDQMVHRPIQAASNLTRGQDECDSEKTARTFFSAGRRRPGSPGLCG